MDWFTSNFPEATVFVVSAWDSFIGALGEGYDILMDWRLLTPGKASFVIVLITLAFFLPIIHLWFKSRYARNWVVEIGFLAVPVALVLLLQTPTGFVGTPDDNCTAYERGKMTFSLLDILVVPKKTTDIYGDAWLVLYVQNDRWGDDVHQCRLSLADARARVLAKAVHDAREGGEGGRFHHGQFTFTFGGRNEIPNVVIKGLKSLKKPYPPEGPRGTEVPPSPPAAQPEHSHH